MSKIDSQLDLVKFLRRSLIDEVSKRLLFSHNERYLMRYQRRPFCLTHSTQQGLSSSDSDVFNKDNLTANSRYFVELLNGIKIEQESTIESYKKKKIKKYLRSTRKKQIQKYPRSTLIYPRGFLRKRV